MKNRSAPAVAALLVAAVLWLLAGGLVAAWMAPHWDAETQTWWNLMDPISAAQAHAQITRLTVSVLLCAALAGAHVAVAWRYPTSRIARRLLFLFGCGYALLAAIAAAVWLTHRADLAGLLYAAISLVLALPMLRVKPGPANQPGPVGPGA